jgi:hypothetical protein
MDHVLVHGTTLMLTAWKNRNSRVQHDKKTHTRIDLTATLCGRDSKHGRKQREYTRYHLTKHDAESRETL